MKRRALLLSRAAWVVTGLALLPAVIAWLQGVAWQPWSVVSYQLFPLLGLVAFTLMWSHYIVGTLRLYLDVDKQVLKHYRDITGWIVLIAILLHPGILVYSRWRDGFGLPPDSYLSYVAPHLKWAVALGVIALLAFLAYELHRWFEQKSWWQFVRIASDIAMFLIIIHGFQLGGHLASGWFRLVWIGYSVTYVFALCSIYARLWQSRGRNVVG